MDHVVLCVPEVPSQSDWRHGVVVERDDGIDDSRGVIDCTEKAMPRTATTTDGEKRDCETTTYSAAHTKITQKARPESLSER